MRQARELRVLSASAKNQRGIAARWGLVRCTSACLRMPINPTKPIRPSQPQSKPRSLSRRGVLPAVVEPVDLDGFKEIRFLEQGEVDLAGLYEGLGLLIFTSRSTAQSTLACVAGCKANGTCTRPKLMAPFQITRGKQLPVRRVAAGEPAQLRRLCAGCRVSVRQCTGTARQ